MGVNTAANIILISKRKTIREKANIGAKKAKKANIGAKRLILGAPPHTVLTPAPRV